MYLTKFGKKIIAVLVMLLAIFAIVGCTNGVTESEKTKALAAEKERISEIYQNITFDPTALREITNSINLVTATKYEDVTVSWTSSEPDILSSAGEIERPDKTDARAELVNNVYIVKVKLTATITGTYTYTVGDKEETSTASETKEFNFTVKCLDNLIGTIAEVKAAAWEYVYVTEKVEKLLISSSSKVFSVGFVGVVTAKLLNGGKGFTVHDGTEGIYVYANNEDINVGDVVRVYGDIYTYYGSLQVGSSITVKKITDPDAKIGEYRRVTVSEWEAEQAMKAEDKDYGDKIGYFGGKLLEVYAKLEKGSSNSDIYKLVDPYDGEVAWVYYKSYEDKATPLDEYVGKYVYIRGASYDRDSRSGKNHLLWDGTIKEAPAPELTDAQKLTIVKAELESLTANYVAGTKFTFPVENKAYGATISWVLSDETTLVKGVFALVEQDTVLTATGTITIGDATDTVEVKLTVKKLSTYTIEEAIKLPKDTVVQLEATVEVIFGSKNYYYLKDATGTLLVYATLPETIKLGDKVILIGAVGSYNGTPQIASVVSVKTAEAGVWQQTAPTKVEIADLVSITDSSKAPYGSYLYATGRLTKNESGYFYLVDKNDATKMISLYNSNVKAEKLVAAAGVDTDVTLFFYFYGNSKADWTTGEKRVIFNGRDGEFFVGDEKIVMPEVKEFLTIKEAKTLAAGKVEVTVQGVVTAVGLLNSDKKFHALIQDETGALYLYLVAGEDALAALKVGDKVQVKGIITVYNGLFELTEVTAESITLVEAGVGAPAVSAMSNELADQAKVVVLENAYYDGKTFLKAGVTYKYYHNAKKTEWLTEAPVLEAGKYYTVKGFINWYNAPQITPIAAVVEVDPTTIPASELALNELAKIDLASSAEADFTLPEGFTWSVVSGTGIALDGLKATVTRGAADQVVVLKAELDGASKEFEVVVPKEQQGDVSEYTYDFVANFATYAAEWKSGYAERTISSTDLGTGLPGLTFVLSNGSKQTGTITDRPVPAAKSAAATQYVTVTSADQKFAKVTFVLSQWTTKTFTDMHLEYFNGTEWVKCSDVITVPGKLSTLTIPEGVSQVRLSYTTASSSNTQFGLGSVVVEFVSTK